VAKQLQPLLAEAPSTQTVPRCVLLGCTHFPPLAPVLREVLGPDIAIIDSAATTAQRLAGVLEARSLARCERSAGATTLLATDGLDRFARIAPRFLGHPIDRAALELVDV
jgi:glutamate racemase